MNSNSNALTATGLTTFTYLSNDIRVVQIDGQPWFAAPHVCRALEMDLWAGTYKWLVGLAPDEKRLATASSHPQLFRGSKARSMSLISESGLYKLIMRSDKPEARKFQDWVTREVLPAIRKDGLYVAGEEHLKTGEMSDDELTLMVMERLRGKIERLKEEKAAAEAKVEQLTGPALVGQITTTRSRKLQLVVDMLPFVNKNMVSSRLMELEQAKPKVLVGETTEIRVARFTAWSVRAREYAVAV